MIGTDRASLEQRRRIYLHVDGNAIMPADWRQEIMLTGGIPAIRPK
jgi:hypothetical protein